MRIRIPKLVLKKKRNIALLFFFSMFMTLCFAYANQNAEDMYQDVFVFYLNVDQTYVVIGICLLFFAFSILKGYFYIDKVTVLLLSSAVLGVIPFLYASTNHYWGNYFSLIVSIISYFLCSQSKVDISEKIYKIICLVCVILSLQVVATELNFFKSLSFSNFSDVSVKGFMHIPIGSSNTIAAYLLPMLIFINSFKRGKINFIISLLTVYALILCRSKNALSLLILFVSFYAMKKIYKFIIKDKSVDRKAKFFALSFVTTIFVVMFIYILSAIGTIVSDLQFSYYSPYSDPFLNYLDSMTSGRVYVFENELTRFTNHIFLGNGFGYDFGYLRSHNWIIELLVQKGVIGFTIYIICVFTAFKIALKNKKDNFSRASFYLLLVIFTQGLFEITVFNAGIDFLIWSISGFLVARTRFLRMQSNYVPASGVTNSPIPQQGKMNARKTVV